MIDFEEYKKFLPQYLSPESQNELFKELEQFPPKFDQRMFSNRLSMQNDVFQGDGLRDMPVINLPDEEVLPTPVLVLSNTCDTSFSNARVRSPSIIYCPIVRLSFFLEQHQKEGMVVEQLESAIRAQKVTRLFYLPEFGGLPSDCVALLDHVVSCSLDVISPKDLPDRRLFSLSNKGFYLFLIKLGIHFTRVLEDVDRG